MRVDWRRLLERVLLIVGVVCLGWFAFVSIDARGREQRSRDALERALTDGASPAAAPAEAARAADASLDKTPGAVPEKTSEPPPAAMAAGGGDETIDAHLVGMLDIPRLKLSAPIVEGDDDVALRGGAGHLSDTPQPWEDGNSAIAAHRDGLFRPLRNIRIGDEVRVRTRRGALRYIVRTTRIVMPSDLSVLDQGDDDVLTLITCYPFNFVGSAPKRFIVRAERIPPEP